MLQNCHFHHLLSDPTRVSIIELLMSGEARTAGEIARILKLAPNQLSHYLKLLCEQEIIKLQPMGKFRVYSIASDSVAEQLEAMAVLAHSAKIHAYHIDPELQACRSCYQHLAGKLGVQFFASLIQNHWLEWREAELHLTQEGFKHFRNLGIPEEVVKTVPLKYCIDFSERRHHLAGKLGITLLHYFVQEKWLVRRQKPRVLYLTPLGKKQFAEHFKLNLEDSTHANT